MGSIGGPGVRSISQVHHLPGIMNFHLKTMTEVLEDGLIADFVIYLEIVRWVKRRSELRELGSCNLKELRHTRCSLLAPVAVADRAGQVLSVDSLHLFLSPPELVNVVKWQTL